MSKYHLSLAKKEWEARMFLNVAAPCCQLFSGAGNQPCSLPLDGVMGLLIRIWGDPVLPGTMTVFLFFTFTSAFPFVMMWRMENASQDLEIIIYVRSLVCRLPSAYKYVISLGRFLQQSVRQAGQVVSFTFQKVSSWILKRWRTEGRLEIRPNY